MAFSLMSFVVPYGGDDALALDLPADRSLVIAQEPVGEPIGKVPAAVRTALDEPLNFPPLPRATVPGDCIVLAVEPGTPQSAAVVAEVAGYLVEQGAAADLLAVLITPEAVAAGERDPRELMPAAWRGEVALEVHAPETTDSLSFLASSQEGKPIHLNRTLLDADLVVPVGCLRSELALGHYGQYGGLYPTFADAKTRARFNKPAVRDTPRQRLLKQRQAIDEVGWLLGTQFTVQVLPGGGDRLLRVLAGAIPDVFRVGHAAYTAAWTCDVPYRASLVVASVAGGTEQQTWENLARALSAAASVVAEGGAIALCTQLSADPGPAVRGLSHFEDASQAIKHFKREALPDARVAVELIRAKEQGKVYLLSQLEESLVEDLGMAAIGNSEDLGRLARRHESYVVLANAQYVIPVLRS
jgi:hypothetical protein